MGHTNSTANLSLPQFIGTDKPTWLGDVNGAFSAIDSYVGTNDAAVAAAVSDASSAISQASAAVNTANTANTTAGNASTAANNAVGVANTANAIAGTVDAKVGLLADLNTTDRTSIVNAINELYDYKVSESTGNATYSSQIAEIAADFANLTAAQKRKAYVVLDDGVNPATILHIFQVAGMFSRSNISGTALTVHVLDFTNSTYAKGDCDGSSYVKTDLSSNTNPGKLILYVG